MSQITRAIVSMLAAVALSVPVAAQDNPGSGFPPIPGIWRGAWIQHPAAAAHEEGVFHFRRALELDEAPEEFIVKVSADNRFRLFVNGTSVGVGPARSDVSYWRYAEFDLAPYLHAGTNVIGATVWNWGDHMPVAQISHRTGFLIEGQSPVAAAINSDAQWQVLWDRSHRFAMPSQQEIGGYYIASPGETIDAGAHPWNWMDIATTGLDWEAALPVGQDMIPGMANDRGAHPIGAAESWQLVPTPIAHPEERPIRFEAVDRATGIAADDAVLQGSGDLTIPANARVTLLLDQGYLTNAYPVIVASGGAGAQMGITYAEALIDAEGNKGNRDEVEGRTIRGLTDRITFDGGDRRRFQTLWWRTWRYVQLDIETGADPLVLHDVHGIFTAYPFEQNASFASDQHWIDPIWEIDWRILRLSAFDTFMDTPYYEQLQYVGDTRVESLISLYNSGDERLMRNAIQLFHQSRVSDGLVQSRYPSSSEQQIPPFALWWTSMVHDYWMLRDDPQFVAEKMPAVRDVMAWFERHIDEESGLLGPIPWWGFLDWAPQFPAGMAPGVRDGNSVPLSLQFAYSLRLAAELEDRFGQPAEAQRYRNLADSIGAAAREHAWSEERGLFADTSEMESFSQHANVLAILSGTVPVDRQRALMEQVLEDSEQPQATFYFRFYVDEAMRQAGLADRYLERLEPWREMIRLGLTTTPESPEPTRSDSHAWSAHPNYHLLATVLGIRPASEGFASVRIEPALGPMQHASGTMPHPSGPISVALRREGASGLAGEIKLPPGLHGTFAWAGQVIALEPGANAIAITGR